MLGKGKLFRDHKTILQVLGVLTALLLAALLLWHGNATSSQASPALVAQVYFDGEYQIGDGPWQKILPGAHISATKGDVTLRGNLHMNAPDGTYVGIYRGEIPVAFYVDHLRLTIREGEGEAVALDTENPLYGASVCGVSWTAYTFLSPSEDAVEIRIHNPHVYGNENAVDDLLANVTLWTGIDFEKDVLERGASQRDVGLLFMIVSLLFLGSALFSTLIYVKNSKILWVLGIVIMFAGTYLTYSSDSISFWSDSVVSNTTILGCSMMFYMLFLLMAMVHLLRKTKMVAGITVAVLGAGDAMFFLMPMLTQLRFYDMWLYWAMVQAAANAVLLGCLATEIWFARGRDRWLFAGLLLPLIAFGVDMAMTDLGVWAGGFASGCVFIVFFAVAMVAVLKIIPQSFNALAKAKTLETEKLVLNAQLAESRVSTMMSQIRPHFIYNTLGSIEQLCRIDPKKAGELVHNFAKYLRGNFGELDNPRPILMSQEMEHVRHYISIENVRFPDMTFSFEMNSGDFHIPALTIQPIVENAIKHGLMKLPKGGTIRVVSYETATHYCVAVEDDGVGFDATELLEERKHVGIRNIRGRLQAMVNGTLEIQSTQGVGTKVLITIPKEVGK